MWNNYKRLLFTLCLLTGISTNVFPQTPGGVGTSLTVWLKANAGVTGTTNVSNWADQSGLGHHATQGTPSQQPSLVANDLNFNPSINFSGGTTIMTLTAPPVDLNTTIFAVAIPAVNTQWRTMFRGTANHHPIIIQTGGTGLGFYDNISGGFKSGGFTWLQNEPALVGLEMRTGDVNFRKNGSQGASINTITLAPAALDFFGNYQGNNQNFGRIAETIIYNNATALTAAEKVRIESYLAVKYGISLSHDYVATDGTTVWNTVTNAVYGNNITGIGRDDNTALDQRKSTNANVGGAVTIDLGGPFGADRNFLLWGDDAGTGASSNIPAGFTMRTNRIWKTAVTGTPGNVSFSVDLFALGLVNTGIAANYSLLLDTDTDFSSGSTVHTAGASIVGNVLSFTGVGFTNGNYFTVAASNVPQPGGVSGLVFWVKAGAGVTGTTNVSNWADQSGFNNAVQATPSQQPSLVTNDINFNPSINFSGTTTIMSLTTPPANLNTTVFTVAVPIINTSWRTMFRGTVNDHPLIIQAGGNGLGYFDGDNVGFKSGGFNWLQNEVAVVGLEMRTGDVNFRKNGAQGASIGTINLAGLNLNFFGNYQGNGQNFGRIAETIIYNTAAALTASDKNKIESYLAVKYGLTLAHDYLSTSASTVWNTTTNAANPNDVTGIGRDDASGLDQRKSKSVNTGTVLTLEKTTPGSAFGNDQSFLIAGDNGGSLGATTTGVPTGFPAFPMRVTRIWRAQVTAAPGTATISFDLGTGIYNSGVAGNYSLLIGNTTDFSAVTPITGGTIASNVLSFSNVTLSDGNFFTLGLPLVPSPGGVVDGLRVWLKSNAGVSSDAAGAVPATDLGPVQRWNDQTSLNNHATNTGTPIYNTSGNLMNFNPTVFYDGASGHNLTYSATNQYSLITMSRMEGTLNRRAFSSRIGNELSGYWNGREDVLHLDGTPSLLVGQAATTNARLYSLTRASSGAYQFFRNGLILNSGGASFNSTIQLGIANGGAFAGESSKEYVTEVIEYDRDLTAPELSKVHSYLGMKYGVTLSQAPPANYVASTGLIVWNATTLSAYANDITAIGRDQASGLDQRKSKSVNPGSVFTVEKTTPASAFGVDLSFFIAGDDATSLGPTTTGVPTGFPVFPMRVTRVWRSQVTGTPGTVTISFDLGTGIYNSGVAGNYSLLVGPSSDFSAVTPIAGGSISSNVISFSNVTITDGQFFTLGLPLVPSPGGVITGLRVWLKANTGVSSDAAGTVPATDLGSVQRWNDQTSLGNNGTSTGTPIYNTTANLINFNPTVFYDGASGHNLNYSALNQHSLITVSKLEGTLNRRTFSSRIGNVLVGFYNGREDVLYLDGNPNILGGAAASTNPRLYSLTRASTGAFQFVRNGLLLNSAGASFNSTVQLAIGNGGATVESSRAYVSEAIQYDRDLTAPELSKVQSYLGIKYGLTLDQTAPTNYVASSGTVIWDGTVNAIYQNSITGIGRDDASGLDQRKSRSVNSRSILILDKGAAFGVDQSYLVAGNDNALLTPTKVGAHPGYPYRITRVWRAQLAGTPGAVKVSFDLGVGIYNTGNAADYSVLIKNADTDFSSGATAFTTGAAFNGSVLTFTGVNFANGDYFTLGMPNVPAPGGVVNNLHLWLKANQGVIGGATASAWNDQSGNGFNVTQATVGNQPTIQTNRVNFNPALQFNGATNTLSLTGGILGTTTYTNANVFVISRANGISVSSIFFEPTAAGGQFNGHIPWSNATTYWDAGNTGTNRLAVGWGGVVNMPYLWSLAASTVAMPSGALQDIYRNGQRIGNDNTMTSFAGNNSTFSIASSNGTNYFNGEISEVVVYSGALTALQLQEIQSYMALKYGVTLSQTTPQDYVASNAAVVFHSTTTHAGYSRDVAGIGRDDNSALDQRKSKSINSTPSDILSLANVDFTTPTAFGTDLQYLVWGHNGLPLSSDITMAPFTHNGASIVRQITRVWSTDKTGSPAGNAIVEVDMNLIFGPTGLGTNNTSDVRLLVDNDATFGNSSAGEHTYTLASVAAGKIYFTVPFADIASGQGFITVGSVNAVTAPLFTPTPGGIAADVRLWLKADAGVTGGATVSAWADQSPYAYSAAQATPANQPTVLTSRLNFNPAISFDGTNDDLTVASGILKHGTYTDLYAYGVARTNVIQNEKLFTETNLAGGQLGAYTPWSDNNVYWDAGDATASNRLTVNWGGLVTIPYLWSLGSSTTVTPSGVRQDIFRNGLRIANDNTMSPFTGNNSNFVLGSQLGANFYNGEVSELLIITSAMTLSQQQRVHTYFALKYGITLNQNTSQNYFASSNAVIFHATTTNSGFRNDIAGIGRDDNSLLDQRKSKSVNAPLDILTMANGNFATPTSFSTDQEFLVWGHNGFPYASDAATPSFTHNGVNLAKRLARVWSTDKTGTPAASVVMEYNMSVIGGPTGPGTNANADVRLLIDNDATFGNGSVGEATLSPDGGFGVTGGTIYFTVPFGNIPSGQGFVTLGSVNALTSPLAPALPGGVAAPLRLWLKSNAGITGVANASAWADQSGNGFSANQATPANQPAILANRINFNTALQFNGSTNNLSITGGILSNSTYSNFTVFQISRTNVVSNSQSFVESTAAGGIFAGYMPWGDNNIYWDAGNSGVNRVNANWGGTITTPYIWTLGANAVTPSQNIYRNGLGIASDNSMGSFNGSSSNFFLGSANGANFYNGEISEFIVYPASLTPSEQQRVQSYLGIKYGITVDQTAPTNYLASDATIIWNATTNSTHKTDIAGIGRDDASGLDQRKSQSVNNKSIVQMDEGAAFANDRNFIVWGNDNILLGPTTTGAFPGFTYRVGRTWKAAVTGTPGPVTITFDLSQGIYNSGNASDYRLLIKPGDTNFSAGATATAGTLVGNTLTFNGITLADGNYFSIAILNVPAPGGVVPNMLYWVKANSGVTGVATASAWADQSGNGFNATQSVPANQPAIQSARVNFNPDLQFNGIAQQLVVTGGVVGTATYSDLHVFGVARTNVITASSFFLENQAAGGRIGVHLPWTDNNTYWDAGSAGGSHRLAVNWGGVVNTNYVWSYTASTTATPSGARQDIYRNGRRIGNDNTMATFTGNNSNLTLGNGVAFYNGEIAELVFYNGTMTLAQLQRIQGYLAIKYGITLDQTVAQDYVASDWTGAVGTKVWNSATAGAYKWDIAAVGRDDNSGLHQKQSSSVNTVNINILSIGNGTGPLAVDNATNANNFAVDRSFFSWGHNNLPLGGSHVFDFGTTTNLEVIKTRLARAWFSQENGTVGTVRLRFDLSTVNGVAGVPGANDLNNVRLLVDADGTFLTGALSVSPTTFNNGTGIVEFEYDFAPAAGFYFSIGSVDLATAPLPVELIAFDAVANEDNVALSWITESEVNNDYFRVESSVDNESWSRVAEVKGKGTTTAKSVYKTTDDSPFIGKSYYRLVQVDFDGKKRFSEVRAVDFKGSGIRMYPNPTARKRVTLEIPTASSTVLISISNLLGQEVYHKVLSGLEPRKQSFLLEFDDLKAGEYLVRIVNGTTFYKKLVIE